MTHVSKYGDSRPARKKPSRGITTPQIIQALESLVIAHDNDWFNFPAGSIGKVGATEALDEARRIVAALRAK